MSTDPTPEERRAAERLEMAERLDKAEGYAEQVAREADIFDDALAAIRHQEDAGELTVRQAADRRVELMERHLHTLRMLRETYLGAGGETNPKEDRHGS